MPDVRKINFLCQGCRKLSSDTDRQTRPKLLYLSLRRWSKKITAYDRVWRRKEHSVSCHTTIRSVQRLNKRL